MHKKETDISLIRKYLNGELDARAMHDLEKRAQDDSLLMDALEGYEKTDNDEQEQLDDINRRLKQRVSQTERRIIPLKFIAVAASVLVVLTIGSICLFNRHPANQLGIAQVKPPVKITLLMPELPAPVKKREIAALTAPARTKRLHKFIRVQNQTAAIVPAVPFLNDKLASADIKKDTVIHRRDDTTPLNEVVVMGYATQRKKDTTRREAAPPSRGVIALQGRVAGVTTTQAPGGLHNGMPVVVNGKVIGTDDKSPLAGVSIQVAGTKINTVTDKEGRFAIPVDDKSKKAKLEVAHVGYQAQQVNVDNQDSLKTIALKPANNSLNEVVTVGYGANRDDTVRTGAHPKDGWDNFRKYLEENAVSPDGKKGVVKLSMQIAPNGAISDISIINGLSKATNDKAIDLIQNGPAWVGRTNGRPEKVTVRIRFSK